MDSLELESEFSTRTSRRCESTYSASYTVFAANKMSVLFEVERISCGHVINDKEMIERRNRNMVEDDCEKAGQGERRMLSFAKLKEINGTKRKRRKKTILESKSSRSQYNECTQVLPLQETPREISMQVRSL